MKYILLCSALWFFSYRALSQDTKIYTTNQIEFYPYFKNAEGTNPGSKACFIEQLNYHVSENFNYPIEALKKNRTGKAYIQFVVDSMGKVTHIKARSEFVEFEKEAVRIIQQIPILQPAQIGNKNSAMVYNFPLAFNYIQGDESLLKDKIQVMDFAKLGNKVINSYDKVFVSPIYKGCVNATDFANCFKKSMANDIMAYVHSKKYTSKKIALAKVYFELSIDKKVSNVNIISADKNLVALITQFLNGELHILEVAKREDGSPVSCFFSADLYFK